MSEYKQFKKIAALFFACVLLICALSGEAFAAGKEKKPAEAERYVCFACRDGGLARPDEYVSGEDLSLIAEAFTGGKPEKILMLLVMDAAEKGENYAGVLLRGEAESVPLSLWRAMMRRLFGNEGSVRGKAEDYITRADAAEEICALAHIKPDDEAQRYYPDLNPENGYLSLYTLMAPPETTAKKYTEGTEDGFFFRDGYLYAVDGAGYLVLNADIGCLHFDSRGRYTSGDEELDDLVAQRIAEVCADCESRMEMLQAVYKDTKYSMKYVGFHNHEYSTEPANGEGGWGLPVAKAALQTGKGNCYCYAARFAYLARGLGYQMYPVGGHICSDNEDHGYCYLYQDDMRYIFDPELEWSKAYWSGEFHNFFMRPYGEIPEWMHTTPCPPEPDAEFMAAQMAREEQEADEKAAREAAEKEEKEREAENDSKSG